MLFDERAADHIGDVRIILDNQNSHSSVEYKRLFPFSTRASPTDAGQNTDTTRIFTATAPREFTDNQQRQSIMTTRFSPMRTIQRAALLLLLIALPCCDNRARAGSPEASRLLADIRFLASDSLQGRATGGDGARIAQDYIAAAFRQAGVKPFGGDYRMPFTTQDPRPLHAVNVVGYIEGSAHPDRWIVVSAHYDHLGVKYGKIYNGADDNASGVAVLLAAARYFNAHRPEHSIIFAAFDAEEIGMLGSQQFVRKPPVARAQIAADINLDMVSRSDNGSIYASGTHYYPWLKPLVQSASERTSVAVRFGHDEPGTRLDDWTNESDQGSFHAERIPFVYFGVEDHPDYHRDTDEFEKIDQGFVVDSMRLVIETVAQIDHGIESARR
jgi:hypothetical protein